MRAFFTSFRCERRKLLTRFRCLITIRHISLDQKRAPSMHRFFPLLLVALLLSPAGLLSQTGSATIRGTVTDSSGAVVPAAKVTVRNSATAVSLESETNEHGIYVVPFLRPGTYSVAAVKTGFQATERPGITLQVADDLAIDISLRVGNASSQVTVEAATPLVNTTDSSLGQVIENRRIVELPLD